MIFVNHLFKSKTTKSKLTRRRRRRIRKIIIKQNWGEYKSVSEQIVVRIHFFTLTQQRIKIV